MTDPTQQLLNRAQSAPLFLLSFRYRDELAAMASAAGWRAIAARRSEGAEQRFVASGAIIAVVDLRGAGAEGLNAVTALSQAAEANGAALLVLGARGGHAALEAALRAGATHVLHGPFDEQKFILALRSAERFALRMIAHAGAPGGSSDVWRDDRLTWEEQGQSLALSPALSVRLKLPSDGVGIEQFLAHLPHDAQRALGDAIAEVRLRGQPRALTHRLTSLDADPVAHHIRLDPNIGQLQGLIELPLTAVGQAPAHQRDPLTGVHNAAAARQWLGGGRAECQAILMIGLSRFDMINDAFGRVTGDAVLRALTRRIQRTVDQFGPPGTLIARVAGATFLVALPSKSAAPRLPMLVDALAEVIERPVITDGREVSVGCSIGGVERIAGEPVADVLRRASEALAEARTPNGKRRHIVTEGGNSSSDAVNSLATDLRAALDKNEIDILFQPQVDIGSAKIVGVEALARWQHPVHGTLSAGTLFAVAERSDYLNALSAHIQKRAMEAAAAWPSSLGNLRLAVNVTAQDIARAGFIHNFLRTVDESGFPRARLTVEITENGLIEDLAGAADLLAALRQAGCRVAIDDFGTGYSSLAYLKALPLDYLKIDKALAQDIVGTARDKVVVRGVIDMARSLGLAVVAEGVETDEQLAALAAQGCNYYQGFLCAEPLDVAALEKLVNSR